MPHAEFTVVGGQQTRCISSDRIEDFIYVGQISGWPYTILSHYATSEPFQVDGFDQMRGMRWLSTSAAFECATRVAPEHWDKFSSRGVFSRFAQGARFLKSCPIAIANLIRRYGQNSDGSGSGMDGYLASLLVKRADAGRIGPLLLKLREEDRIENALNQYVLLVTITAARMRMDKFARKTLLSTGDKLIVELDRFAEANVKKGAAERAIWGAYVSRTDGRLYGCNLMGKILMQVRWMIKAEADAGRFGDETWRMCGATKKRKRVSSKI
jgi:hypothetical protein